MISVAFRPPHTFIALSVHLRYFLLVFILFDFDVFCLAPAVPFLTMVLLGAHEHATGVANFLRRCTIDWLPLVFYFRA